MALYVDTGYFANEDEYTWNDVFVDWYAKVIYIPRNYMSLVQASPIEIRLLDVNSFRLLLKGLEADSLEGMAFPDTHTHNTEVNIGGVQIARVVQIINGYTITFENGSYAVNVVGGNTNFSDVLNLNNVQVRSSNSAGLITLGEQLTFKDLIRANISTKWK